MNAEPRRKDAVRNRARLVEVAGALFAEVGTEVASMNDIARRAGVGPGTLWRHFADKEALVAEVVGQSLDDLSALARDLLADPAEPDPITPWTAALVRHIGHYRGFATRYAHASRAPEGPLGTRCQAVERAAAELVDHARARGRVRADLTATELIGLATAIAWLNESTGLGPAASGGPDAVALTGAVSAGAAQIDPAPAVPADAVPDAVPAVPPGAPSDAASRLLALIFDGVRPR